MALIHLYHDNYDINPLKIKLEQGFEMAGGLRPILGSRQRLLLKPNLVLPGPISQGHQTHPHFLLAVAELLLDHGYQVGVGESPGTGSVSQCLHKIGMIGELKRRQIPFFTFSGRRPPKNKLPQFPGFGVAKQLDQWDGLINLPKLKSHQQTQFTGAVKNLFGCIPGKKKALYHFTCKQDDLLFMRMILAVLEEANPLFHIADGIHSLHRGGPIHGQSFPSHQIYLSDSAIELDWAFASSILEHPEQTTLFRILGPQPPPQPIGEPFRKLGGFEFSPPKPIQFSLPYVVRSFFKGVKAKIKSPWRQWQ